MVEKNLLRPVHQPRDYEFSMRFTGKKLPQLDRTEFWLPDGLGSKQCLRGYKGPPGRSSQQGVTKAPLQWSNGVKAMCLFFLQTCGRLRAAPEGDFSFEGGRGTPAASLDQVLGKGASNVWMADMFGTPEDGGHTYLHSLIYRLNPDGKKRDQPFRLQPNRRFFAESKITIHWDDVEVKSLEMLDQLIEGVGRQGKWELPPYQPVATKPIGDNVVQKECAVDRSSEDAYRARVVEYERRFPELCRGYAFRLVKDTERRLFRPTLGGDVGAVMPSFQDHYEGGVWWRRGGDVIVEHLQRHGWTYVEGSGATGKTTLGLAIALSHNPCRGPAFYLSVETNAPAGDAASGSMFAKAAEEARLLFAHDVLVLVDDIHRNYGLAEALLNSWEGSERKAKLLLLGRKVVARTDPFGRDYVQDRLQAHRVTVDLEEDEIAPLACAILCRYGVRLKPEQALSARRGRQMFYLFAADLRALTYAVAESRDSLLAGADELSLDAAFWFIKSELFRGLNESALHELKLAALAEALGCGLPADVFPVASFEEALSAGTLYRDLIHGRLAVIRFANRGLAELVLRTWCTPAEYPQLFFTLTERCPHLTNAAFLGMSALSELEESEVPQPEVCEELRFLYHDVQCSPYFPEWAKKIDKRFLPSWLSAETRARVGPGVLPERASSPATTGASSEPPVPPIAFAYIVNRFEQILTTPWTKGSSKPIEPEPKSPPGNRDLEATLWDQREAKYPAGTRIKSKVQSIDPSYLLIALEAGLSGMVHISNISCGRKIKNLAEVFRTGDEVEAVVIEVNKVNRYVVFSLDYNPPPPAKKALPIS